MWSSSKLLGLKIFQASLAELVVGDGRQPPPLSRRRGTRLTATHGSKGEQEKKGIAMCIVPVMQTAGWHFICRTFPALSLSGLPGKATAAEIAVHGR